ncbi:uncharacterized protein LOC118478432 [Aplysia californica]|uniref:Uncharacterized protein LOC118478432 n=1 Tax=Aplysia californica TaxID=6500 RepID=A0ABM1VZS7_APLCA|nr:uncharacterized protein LOC118478432 [Aplysia californica]
MKAFDDQRPSMMAVSGGATTPLFSDLMCSRLKMLCSRPDLYNPTSPFSVHHLPPPPPPPPSKTIEDGTECVVGSAGPTSIHPLRQPDFSGGCLDLDTRTFSGADFTTFTAPRRNANVNHINFLPMWDSTDVSDTLRQRLNSLQSMSTFSYLGHQGAKSDAAIFSDCPRVVASYPDPLAVRCKLGRQDIDLAPVSPKLQHWDVAGKAGEYNKESKPGPYTDVIGFPGARADGTRQVLLGKIDGKKKRRHR